MSNHVKKSRAVITNDHILLALGAVCSSTMAIPSAAMTLPSVQQGIDPGDAATFIRSVSAPLIFEPNVGQFPGEAAFLARGNGYRILISDDGFKIKLDSSSDTAVMANLVSVRFIGTDGEHRAVPEDGTGGVSRYVRSDRSNNDPLITGHYRRVSVANLYPGISLKYYGIDRQLEYDFVLAPYADPRQIEMSISGVHQANVDMDGNLVLALGGRTFVQKRPVAFQEIRKGVRVAVDARYSLAKVADGSLKVALAVGSYDRNRTLIIDPLVISFSRLLGGLGEDAAYGVTTDSSGNIFVAGMTSSNQFPGALTGANGYDPYVSKLGASGDVIYTTILQTNGGGQNKAVGITLDNFGNAYVVGTTSGTLAGNSVYGASDAFAVKLGASGDLEYVRMLGGSGADTGAAIAVDASGSAYVVGATSSTDFLNCIKQASPCNSNFHGAYLGGTSDGFVVKLGASGQTLFESFIGGSGSDALTALALDAGGNAWVAGYTTNASTAQDAYVLKIGASGYFDGAPVSIGGSGSDFATAISLDGSGMVYIAGGTNSTNFPTVAPLQRALSGASDGFVAELHPTTRALQYSSYLGGSGSDQINALMVDVAGNAYVTGVSSGTGFPLTGGGYQQAYGGGTDAFAAKIGSSGSDVNWATYLGGSGDDVGYALHLSGSGALTVVGTTASANYPIIGTSSIQAITAGEAFVTQFGISAPAVSLSSNSLSFGSQTLRTTSAAQAITLRNPGTGPLTISSIQANGDYAYATTCGLTLDPGATCTISITFTPMVGGSRTGTITLVSDAVGSPHIVSLSGTGALIPQVIGTISFSSAALAVGGTTTANATGGASGSPVIFTSGSTDICTASGTNGKTITGMAPGNCLITANQAGNTNFGAAIPVTQSIVVSSVPVVALSPSSLTFADQHIGTTSPAQSIVLTNSGGAALAVTSILPSIPVFGVTHTCGTSLAVGGLCNLNVTFSPIATGTRLGSITLTSNGAGSPHSITVSGIGVATNAPICALSAAPATVRKGGAATLTTNCSPAATYYAWTGGTCAGTTASTCTVTPGVTTTYSVTGTNSYGSNSSSATVTVKSVDLTPILMLLLD